MMKCFLLIFVSILVATVVDATNCGVPSKSVGLIVNGKDFNRGKWPWMAALMLRFQNGNKFFCGGVLVSKTKVLTAAHCIHEKQKTRVNARNILILLGAYDLSNLNQNGVFSVAPSEIIIHPDWNPYVERYDADIAVISLEDEVPFTQFIRPICIASNDLDYREGHVAGWGKSKVDAKGHEIFPKELKIPIWTNEYCFLESIEFVTLASRRTLCAGNRDGASVCHGDSGGGLFVESNGVFFLKGLVSASLLSQGLCDVSNFALYTNVNKFKDWIDVPTEQATVGVADLQHETCGVMSASAGLVRNGIKSTNTQWPWAVFVFNKAFQNTIGNDTYSSFEVGTLISKRHVLTSGYFVTQDDKENGGRKPIPTNLIKTYFGVINIDEFARPQTLVLDDAEKIMIHPELSNIESLKFANFAIIKLKIDVTFSEFISPICLSSFTGDPYSLSGKHPYGVGMGYSELTKTKDRKHSPMRIRTAEVCESVFGYSLKAADTKNKKSSYFCAGGDGKSSSCWSDNPLYMKFGNKWFLHAFHTISFTNADGCLTDKPALYEIAGQYYNWIMNMIKD